MSNVHKDERRPSYFEVVALASTIYNDVLDLCLKMPNRYTYLVLQDILHLAGKVADYTKAGNSIMPNKDKPLKIDVELRRGYFLKASSALSALVGRMNFFLDRPQVLRHKVSGKMVGPTQYELDQLSDKMKREGELIEGTLRADFKRYSKAYEQ